MGRVALLLLALLLASSTRAELPDPQQPVLESWAWRPVEPWAEAPPPDGLVRWFRGLEPWERPLHALAAARLATDQELAELGADLLPALRQSAGPGELRDLLLARVLLSEGRLEEALAAARRVPAESPWTREARVYEGRALCGLGRREEGLALLRELAGGPADAAGAAALEALLDLGAEGDWAERLWARHPARAARRGLGPPDPLPPGLALERAEALAAAGDFRGVVELLGARRAELPGAGTAEGCRARFLLGRALYKTGSPGDAATLLDGLPAACAEAEPETAVRAAYLLGRALSRRGRHRQAARAYEQLATLFPGHRYADDGWVLGGMERRRAGEREAAWEDWRAALRLAPGGDTTPTGVLELALDLRDAGRGAEALEAARALASLPPDLDPDHQAAGLYWAGLWALEDGEREEALSSWERLCREQPWTYSALLAYARLRTEDPGRAEQVQERARRGATAALDDPWLLPAAFVRDPGVQRAAELLAAGLVDEARALWDALPPELLEDAGAPARAWWALSLSAAGEPVAAHRELRSWLRAHPPRQADLAARRLLRVAYPDLWWPEVQEASEGARFPARLFHALVRTESNFDPGAVSWAGARGLCQLMPSTGRAVGRELGLELGVEDLLEPSTNLRVGARYLDDLFARYGGSPFLAVAAYNAGETRVDAWLRERGELPADLFVERIPFSETRDYVKRVLGSWQAYRWLQGEGFAELSAWLPRAAPAG